MGLIRKTLHVATLGAVAPDSRKQRVAAQTLGALQGETPAQVRRIGTRTAHSVPAYVAQRQASGAARSARDQQIFLDMRDKLLGQIARGEGTESDRQSWQELAAAYERAALGQPPAKPDAS
jgi:hypothetical protein